MTEAERVAGPNYSLQNVPSSYRQSDQKHCFSCAQVIHVTAASCPCCGASQVAGSTSREPAPRALAGIDSVFCYGCGDQIHAAALACPKCGAPHRQSAVNASDKSRTTAIVLAFLLGGIGAHKFYLGSIGWGVVYLIFSWSFVPMIVAAIEGLIYLTQNDQEFARANR